VRGFDGLVAAADQAAAALGLTGFAQIGHSSVLPSHLEWARFLPEEELRQRLSAARIVVCHGGMGILGEAMRAGRPILAVPRTGPTTADNPANDQRDFLQRLASLHPIEVCPEPAGLAAHLGRLLRTLPDRVDYRLTCDVPAIVSSYLSSSFSSCPSGCRPP
jgi:predicted glycosyltransferase